MNDEQFNNLTDILTEHLETKKEFVQNPQRIAEMSLATETACRLFSEAKIEIKDDSLQMGAIILEIEDFDLTVREPERFVDLINKANNFEIYHCGNDMVKLAILFQDVLIRI